MSTDRGANGGHGRCASMLCFPYRPSPMEDLYEANGSFAINLLKMLGEEDSSRNVFFSPLSISSALAMVFMGAKGNTATQMSQVCVLAFCPTRSPQISLLLHFKFWLMLYIKLKCSCLNELGVKWVPSSVWLCTRRKQHKRALLSLELLRGNV